MVAGQMRWLRYAIGYFHFANAPGIRLAGEFGVIELVSNKQTKAGFAPELDIGGRLSRLTYDNGVIVRGFANAVMGVAPALCCTHGEIDMIFDRVERLLDALMDQPDVQAALS